MEKSKIKIIIKKKSSLRPLIKWSGGKGDEIKIFDKYLPPFKTYIEPFVGGGALYFHLNPQSAIINDIHTDLINFYDQISKGYSSHIRQFMDNHSNNENTYYHVRDEMTINTDLDKAKQFYYLRKTCYRGMLRYNQSGGFNVPFGRYKTLNYEELSDPRYEVLLHRTIIENTTFSNIFQKYDDPNNFMFLDPPYDSVFTDYGYCKFGRPEHEQLAQCFKNTKNKCLMIIGKTDFIVDLYKDYIVTEYDKKYKFRIHSGRVDDKINSKHLIVVNYKI